TRKACEGLCVACDVLRSAYWTCISNTLRLGLRHSRGPFLSICGMALLLVGAVQSVSAFSFIGPLEAWMVSAQGLNPLPFDGNLNGPHNLGEEFRRNTPVMYWACDANFLDFFGSNGLRAVEMAMSQLNSVGNVSSYSLDLSEWPLE